MIAPWKSLYVEYRKNYTLYHKGPAFENKYAWNKISILVDKALKLKKNGIWLQKNIMIVARGFLKDVYEDIFVIDMTSSKIEDVAKI